MASLRALRRPVVAVVVSALAAAISVVLSPAIAAQASIGDRIAPVVDTGADYTQSFVRSDGPVGLMYALSGPRLSQSSPSTALMTSSGTSVGYAPAAVGPSTGALIDNRFTADCAGGTTTATDCGQSGTIKINFDSPVSNPTIHVAGLGGSQTVAGGFANFGTYVNLTASTSSTAAADSAAFDSIIGTATNLQLTTGGRLQTAGLRPSVSCDSTGSNGATTVAGCGSVLVAGTNLTSITLTLGLHNSGAATSIAGNTVQDAFLLDVSIPDNPPALANFQCSANSIYGLDQNDWNINRIDVTTGAQTFVGHVNAAAGSDLNGLAIKSGGGSAYAIKRTVTPGGPTTIYRLDPTTNTTTTYAGPTLTQTTSGTQIVEGAINPANGIYYFALIGGAGVEIYGFDTNTNTPIVGRIARLSGFSGISGNFAFDRAGRLVLTSSTGNGTATANPLIHVSQPLPSTGDDASLVGQIVGYLQPNGSINGMAFDLPQGYLYTNSSTGDQSILHQVNPTSGADLGTRPITYLGRPTNEVSDLGSCHYNSSIQLQNEIVSRVSSTDQFTVSITGGGIGVSQTGTTSGARTGVQTAGSATAGPIPALAGRTYAIKEAAGNRTTKLTNYATTWRCVNLLVPNRNDPNSLVASGTGTSGRVVLPTPTDADGIPLGCYFQNVAIAPTTSITRTTNQTGIGPANRTVNSDPSSAVIAANPQPSLSLVKQATVDDVNLNGVTDQGDTISWTFTVTNTGNVTLNGLVVNDPVAGAVTCDTSVLAAKASTACTADVTHVISAADVDAGVVNNTATASGTDPFGTRATSLPSSTSTPIDTSSGLTILTSASPSTITAAGQTISYSFTVTNAGNQTITGLAVSDTFTAPAAPALAITCPRTTLGAGTTVLCTATYTSTQADVDSGTIINTASATGKNPAGDIVTSPPSTATVTATRTATLGLVKSASPTLVTAAGQTVTYSFTVTNTGNVTVGDLSIADTMTSPAGPALVVACPGTALLPGASTICTATYTVTQADVDNGTIKNAATANGTNPQGGAVASNESNATVTANPAGALTLVTSATPTTVTTVGQSVNYSFLVRNTGNVTIADLAIADAFTAPAGPALAITCPVAMLAPGASTTCTGSYSVEQQDLERGAIDNSATASGKDPLGSTITSNQSTATVATNLTPTLTIVKSVAPTSVSAAGQLVTYNFTVTNTGDVTVTGVTINDTFTAPAGPVPTIACLVTTLSPTASTTCTATYTATQADMDAGTITNSATASALDPSGEAVTSSPSSAIVTVAPTSALAVVKSASPTTVTVSGDQVTYSFTVTNDGNVTITSVTINDTLTSPAGPELTAICPVATLAPNASTICTATYSVTQADIDSGSITNSATASGVNPSGEGVTSPPSTATVVADPNGSLTIVKSASPETVTAAGQRVTYNFLVTNSGNVTISTIAINDTFTAPAGPVPAITCPLTTLAPKGTTTCTGSYSVTQSDIDNGTIVNSATATGKAPGGGDVISPPSSATVNARSAPALAVVKSASPASVNTVDQTVTYSFLVTNTGNVTLTNLAVDDQLVAPAGPALTVVCPVTRLPPGASTTCTAGYDVTQADIDNGAISNSATARGTGPTGSTVTSPPSTATVPATRTPALAIVKTAAPTIVSTAGQTVIYSFVVTNTGNVTISDLVVTDALAAPAAPELAVTCPVTRLAPLGVTTCTAAYTLTQADIDSGAVNNTATVSGVDPSGTTTTSPPSTAIVSVTQTPALTLVTSAAPTVVSAARDKVIYSLLATNTGNTSVTNVAIQDTFTAPAGPMPAVSCPATTLTPGASTTCTASYTVTQQDMDKGRIDNSAVATGTAPLGGAVTSKPSTASVTAAQLPALSLVTTASPTSIAAAAAVVSYRFLVTNTGNTTITSVRVTDVFTPAKPNLTVQCPVSSLAPAAVTTCTLSYTATQADVNRGLITNTGVAAGTAPGNTPVQSAPSTAVVTAPAAPALTVVTRASTASVTMIGQLVTYSFLVTNAGNVTVSGIAIADTLTAPASPALVVSCPGATLDPGKAMTCTGTYTVTATDFDNGSVKNLATATGNPPSGPPITSPPSGAIVVATPLPSIQLKKTATANDLNNDGIIGLNDTISWTFTVTNTGNVTLTDVAVDDVVAGAVTCPAELIAAGVTETCRADFGYQITQVDVDAGRVDNTATAAGTGPNGARVTADPSSTTTPIGARPTLSLVASGATLDRNNDGRVGAGDWIALAFRVTNTGNVTVSRVSVTDPAVGAVSCALTSLAPGASTSCAAGAARVITQSDIDVGSYSTTATAGGVDPKGDPVTSPPSTVTVSLPAVGQLGLVKSATVTDNNHNGVNDAGDSVVWSFLVTNVGTVTLVGITVNDPTAGGITCPRPALEPVQSMICRSTAHVITAAESAKGMVTNTATVTGLTPNGGSVTSPPASATVTTVGTGGQVTNDLGTGTGTGQGNGGGTAYTGADNLPGLVWLSVWSLLLGMLLLALGSAAASGEAVKT